MRRFSDLPVIRALVEVIVWLGSHSGLVLLAMLLVVAGTWGFIELVDEVREGTTQEFDEWVLKIAAQHQRPWLEEAMRDMTALGGVIFLTLVTVGVAGYLMLRRKWGAVWLLVIAVGGGFLLSLGLKHTIARDRPELLPHRSHVVTASFPSGHSMLSAVVYLTLGSLLTRIERNRLVKWYFLFIALLLTFLVGVSRVYLGVHWPTDVLAGWTAGLVWALLCWLVTKYLQHRGTVENLE
jgi:undecaprenyl-diphosphatase